MDRPGRNFLIFAGWMTAYLVAYAAIAVSIRTLAGTFSIVEIAAIRSAGSLLIAGVLIWRSGLHRFDFTRIRLRDDLARSLIHLIGSLALIWCVSNLPLSLVSTIEFSGPLFAAIIVFAATRRLPEAVPALGLAIIACGTVLLLARLGVTEDFRVLVAIAAVAALTTSNILMARLALRRETITIIFIMHAIQLPLFLLLAAVVPEGWIGQPRSEPGDLTPMNWLFVGLAGLALIVGGFLTQAALANASRHSTPLQLCAADVLRIPLITLVAYVVLNEMPASSIILPGLLVVAGAVISSLPNRRTLLAEAVRGRL